MSIHRENYRETFSTSRSHRESHSPSIGRLHKQRESFGPTVCLFSKSAEEPREDATNEKLMILMLSIEIQRLNRIVSSFHNNANKNDSEESDVLRRQITYLKEALEKSEQERIEENEKQNSFIYRQKNIVSDYEGQINVYTRRIKEHEEQIGELKAKNHQLEEDSARARAEASRINMNLMMNSRQELQKSMARDRSQQIDLWREKLAKYEQIINEQKSVMNQLKFTIDRNRNAQLQSKQRSDYQISNLRTDNQELSRRIERLQNQLAAQSMNTTQSRVKELDAKDQQIDRMRVENRELRRDKQILKDKNEQLEKDYQRDVGELKRMIIELREQLGSVYDSEEKKKYEALRIELARFKLENHNLKGQLSKIKRKMNEEIDSLNEELEHKELKLKKITKKNRKIETERRMNKSYSDRTFNLNGVERGKSLNSFKDLDGIIDEVKELQDSNTRVSRLIETKRMKNIASSSVSGSLYMGSYANYGL